MPNSILFIYTKRVYAKFLEKFIYLFCIFIQLLLFIFINKPQPTNDVRILAIINFGEEVIGNYSIYSYSLLIDLN